MSTNSCALDTIEFEGFNVGRTRLGICKRMIHWTFFYHNHLDFLSHLRWMGSAISGNS